ncbi:hypothetical protein [Vibrio alginolyticus]|uniref:hypothetical protein n=1 Tax=Vibrio alginolyticus TaxID=663 RepID=UPI001BD53739|nr:hypothetical protein [Vibrio alginolyticus]ELB2819372.1 hypothetical protein [Vibrio alginolyticus]MBT0119383.1 hypothetical protein [Vibrio alginolyticus]
MSFFSRLIGLFKVAGVDSVTKTINDVSTLADKLFTSDEERLQWSQAMAKLNQASQSAVARTARGSLIWALAINLVYSGVVRDVLIGFGLNLPPSAIDMAELLEKAMFLLTGGAA